MTPLPSRAPNAHPQPQESSSAARGGGWTTAAVETLKALWADDSLSASLIARRLGVSRNAVLGKIHRLGLSNRRTGPKAPRAPRPPRVPRPRRPPRTAAPATGTAPATPPLVEIGPGMVARLEDMPAHGCHWPIGDPMADDFRFCGRRAAIAPYCDAHRAVAYRPGGPKPAEALLRRFAA